MTDLVARVREIAARSASMAQRKRAETHVERARRWQWIQDHAPELACMLREMRAAGLDPQMPIIAELGDTLTLREATAAPEPDVIGQCYWEDLCRI